jgi:group I intron endonuclease
MSGFIYKITSPSGKIYIGQTFNFERRMSSYRSGYCKNQKILFRSLIKYGFENHKVEIIDNSDSIKELLNLEKFYIELFNSYNSENGMNLTRGGDGCNIDQHSEETKLKISNTKKNSPKTEKQILANLRSFGVKHTDERNLKKSISQGGENHWAYGKKMSDLTKFKKSKSMRKKYEDGYLSPRKGIELAEEIKQKIKLSKSIPISQFSKNGDWIKDWISAKDASIELNISHGNINASCKGKRKTAGGYIWKYKNNNYEI